MQRAARATLRVASVRGVCSSGALVATRRLVAPIVSRSPRFRSAVACLQYKRFYSTDAESEFIFEVSSDEEFSEKVVNSTTPVIVDFYADWCGPCKLLGPRLKSKINGRGGELVMATVNVDYAADLAVEHQVKVVPTVVAFRDGQELARFEGSVDDVALEQFLNQATGG